MQHSLVTSHNSDESDFLFSKKSESDSFYQEIVLLSGRKDCKVVPRIYIPCIDKTRKAYDGITEDNLERRNEGYIVLDLEIAFSESFNRIIPIQKIV